MLKVWLDNSWTDGKQRRYKANKNKILQIAPWAPQPKGAVRALSPKVHTESLAIQSVLWAPALSLAQADVNIKCSSPLPGWERDDNMEP